MKRVLLGVGLILGLLGVQIAASSYIVTPSVIIVDPTQDLQLAVDRLPALGGEIRLGPGTYTLTSTLRLKRGTHIVGQGWAGIGETAAGGPWECPVVIYMANKDSNIVEAIDAPYCLLQNVELKGAGVPGEQIGIASWASHADSTHTITPGMTLTRVLVRDCGSHGIYLRNNYLTQWTNVFCYGNFGDGAKVDVGVGRTPHFTADNCWFYNNGVYGFEGWQMGVTNFRGCSFQKNWGPSGSYFVDCTGVRFDQCNWEDLDVATTVPAESLWTHINGYTTTAGPNAPYGSYFYRCSNFYVSGGVARVSLGIGHAFYVEDCHDMEFDQLVIDHFQWGAFNFRSNAWDTVTYQPACRNITLGTISMPNQECAIIDPTCIEGQDTRTGATHRGIKVKDVQHFLNDDYRDWYDNYTGHASNGASSLRERVAKVKGQVIYVETPTLPTQHYQYWSSESTYTTVRRYWKGVRDSL